MRIILAHKFHRYTGGADVFYLDVGRVLKEKGHEVAYFSTIHEDNIENDFSNYFVQAPNFKSGSLPAKINAFRKIPYNRETKNKFEQLISDFKPDIVHAFGVITQLSPSLFDAANNAGIPLVVSLNDYKHICPNYKLFHHGKICEDCKGGRFYKAIVNKCSHESFSFSFASAVESYIHSWLNIYRKNIDLFLFASDFMAKKTEDFWGEDSFKWSKLLNPYQIPSKNINNDKSDFGLYFGRIIEEKGVHLILEALESRKDIPFKIVGDGPQLDELKLIAEKKELNNVSFLGPLWGEELDNYLYKAKFAVVPSVWHENFPYVILQSFAAGTPVIGSNLGGIPELLDNGKGLTFDTNNISTLVDAVSLLYENDELCDEMQSKARAYLLETFNDDAFYSSIMENYKMILK